MLKTKSIPFNKPTFLGNENNYLQEAIQNGHISGNGHFTKKCHDFFQEQYHFKKVLLTTSCTDALEMSAILAEIKPGDEVIVPSFTFPSTANAFILRGAKIVFADSQPDHPNIDVKKLPSLLTSKTKAIVLVHYAGVACDMNPLLELAKENQIFLIEDAAQAIDSYYDGLPLGGIGHFGAFSFHETKNISSGEGGLLTINDPAFQKRSEIIWEKGTNRTAFFRGEVKKYGWVDIGSSFLPADIIAALLFSQLENLRSIQSKRIAIWERYYEGLKPLDQKKLLKLPIIPSFATNNAHMFYLICQSLEERTALTQSLKQDGIHAIFHYLPLHNSDYFKHEYQGGELPYAQMFSECLLRLPLYYHLDLDDVDFIVSKVHRFYAL